MQNGRKSTNNGTRSVLLTLLQHRALLSVVSLWLHVWLSEARVDESHLFAQIDKDLHEFRDGITLDMVEQVYCSNDDQGSSHMCLPALRDCRDMTVFQRRL